MLELDTFVAVRRRIRAFAESIPEEAALRIPAGFNNNVAWNLGHIVVTQQLLCYKLSGLPLAVDEELVQAFGKGSSPRDWTSAPQLGDLYPRLTDLADQFVVDCKAQRFGDFTPYMTSAGVELTSLERAFEFSCIHDGIHLGYAMALLRAA